MKNLQRIGLMSALLAMAVLVMSLLPGRVAVETKYLSKKVSISIKGTSSLHDWEMKSGDGTCEAVFVMGSNNKISALSGLRFTVPSKSLKSGHKLMDKNTYKALKTEEHPNIAFTLSHATVNQVDANTYQVTCSGKLSIAGTTHDTELKASGKRNASDNSILFTGTKKMKMTDYNVQPPTVMMGTIKTGNDIAITYELLFTN